MLEIGTKIPLFAEGNATSEDVLEGKTFSTSNGNNLKGNIKNCGVLNCESLINNQTYEKGYYESINITGLNSTDDTKMKQIINDLVETYNKTNILEDVIKNEKIKDLFKSTNKDFFNLKSFYEFHSISSHNEGSVSKNITINIPFEPLFVFMFYKENKRNDAYSGYYVYINPKINLGQYFQNYFGYNYYQGSTSGNGIPAYYYDEENKKEELMEKVKKCFSKNKFVYEINTYNCTTDYYFQIFGL